MKKILFFVTCLFIVGSCLGNFQLTLAQSSPCDPLLAQKKAQNRKIAYRKRAEDRCEGFYRAKVRSRRIDLVRFVKGNFFFPSVPEMNLQVTSPLLSYPKLRVRAIAIPRKIYYRMDAFFCPGKRSIGP